MLDMGKPVKILDLARHLIELSGLEPEKDIAIEFTGLRPGEKLFEELNLNHESLSPTAHPKIMRLRAEPRPLPEVQRTLGHFADLLYKADGAELRQLIQDAVPEYAPKSNVPPAAPTVSLSHRMGEGRGEGALDIR